MPTFLNGHVKARNRSVQLDGSNPFTTQAVSLKQREPIHTPPLSLRISSMADQENQNPSFRHYRSMLVVDAPSLGPHKPMSYDEFRVEPVPGIFSLDSSVTRASIDKTALHSTRHGRITNFVFVQLLSVRVDRLCQRMSSLHPQFRLRRSTFLTSKRQSLQVQSLVTTKILSEESSRAMSDSPTFQTNGTVRVFGRGSISMSWSLVRRRFILSAESKCLYTISR